MKGYYGELTHFLIEKQNKARNDELDTKFANELEDFLHFWEKTFKELEQVSREEVNNIIHSNKELSTEAYEILEQVVGFKPPPDKMFNDLMAIRSMAVKLKNDETVKLINFDYLKKRNQEINEKWIKERRHYIVKRMKAFEELLSKQVEVLKYHLNQELWRLQRKRQNQYDKMMVKYMKCRNIVSVINNNELHGIKKLKTHFMTKNGVPKIDLPEELETDNILAELEPNPAQLSLFDKFKALAVKNSVNLQIKSNETIEIIPKMTPNQNNNIKVEKGKTSVINVKPNNKVLESPQKNGKVVAKGNKKEMLNHSMESQRTVTKKNAAEVQKKVKAK